MKGDACAFAHVDEQGKDWHAPMAIRSAQPAAQELPKRTVESVAESAAAGNSSTAMAKRQKHQPPEEQHEAVKQLARAEERSIGRGSMSSQDSSETALFTWSAKQNPDIHKWLHEERSVPDQKCDLFARHAVQLITSNGETVYRCPYEEYRYDIGLEQNKVPLVFIKLKNDDLVELHGLLRSVRRLIF